MRKLLSASALVFCIGAPVALWEGYRFLPRSVVGTVPAPSFAEGVTIVLAALAIVLACLALFVGVLAIWGYQSIKSEAITAAERGVQKAIEDSVKDTISRRLDDDSIKRALAKEVPNVIRRAVKLAHNLEYPRAFPQAEPPNNNAPDEPIGTEYPGDKP